MNASTCEDFKCEWNETEGEHSHTLIPLRIGKRVIMAPRPYLRRVVMPDGTIVDGRTGLAPTT